jgi:hypothetical protein
MKCGDRGGLAEGEQTHGKKKAKCALTSTGLLMEGLEQPLPNDTSTIFDGSVLIGKCSLNNLIDVDQLSYGGTGLDLLLKEMFCFQ